jgi:hypothetical protein
VRDVLKMIVFNYTSGSKKARIRYDTSTNIFYTVDSDHCQSVAGTLTSAFRAHSDGLLESCPPPESAPTPTPQNRVMEQPVVMTTPTTTPTTTPILSNTLQCLGLGTNFHAFGVDVRDKCTPSTFHLNRLLEACDVFGVLGGSSLECDYFGPAAYFRSQESSRGAQLCCDIFKVLVQQYTTHHGGGGGSAANIQYYEASGLFIMETKTECDITIGIVTNALAASLDTSFAT